MFKRSLLVVMLATATAATQAAALTKDNGAPVGETKTQLQQVLTVLYCFKMCN